MLLAVIMKYIDRLTTTPAAHSPFRGVCPSANFFERKPLKKVDLQSKQVPQELKWAPSFNAYATTFVRPSSLDYYPSESAKIWHLHHSYGYKTNMLFLIFGVEKGIAEADRFDS
ncbi:hypothetical protein ACTWP4_08240 [Gracilibacillus sp. D59]|uniref:hypothetical protein n=1 Tax=Gracilibacillus sp. D59 TaxID=3457434 RepID=UPI003FCDEE8E